MLYCVTINIRSLRFNQYDVVILHRVVIILKTEGDVVKMTISVCALWNLIDIIVVGLILSEMMMSNYRLLWYYSLKWNMMNSMQRNWSINMNLQKTILNFSYHNSKSKMNVISSSKYHNTGNWMTWFFVLFCGQFWFWYVGCCSGPPVLIAVLIIIINQEYLNIQINWNILTDKSASFVRMASINSLCPGSSYGLRNTVESGSRCGIWEKEGDPMLWGEYCEYWGGGGSGGRLWTIVSDSSILEEHTNENNNY